MNPVKITANREGQVVVPNSPGSEYGYIRVESKNYEINAKGFAQPKNRSALIKGKVTDLQEMARELNYHEGKELPGRIAIEETLEAQYEGQAPKRAGNDGEVCCLDGQPIYRNGHYDATGTREDVFIAHNNEVRTSNRVTTQNQAAVRF